MRSGKGRRFAGLALLLALGVAIHLLVEDTRTALAIVLGAALMDVAIDLIIKEVDDAGAISPPQGDTTPSKEA